MKEDLKITDSDFEIETINSEIPVMVDFWASWCIPSQMMMPILVKLSSDYRGKAKIKKLNVDQNPRIRDKYKILGCPTFVLFKDGVEVARKVGAQSEGQLRDLLESVLDQAVGKQK